MQFSQKTSQNKDWLSRAKNEFILHSNFITYKQTKFYARIL